MSGPVSGRCVLLILCITAIKGELLYSLSLSSQGKTDQANGWEQVVVSIVFHGYICGRSTLDEAEIVRVAFKQDVRRQ